MFIDTHVHLNDPKLYIKLPQVVKDAIDAKVTKFIVVGYDLKSSELAINLAKSHKNMFAGVGFHPTEANISEKDFEWLEQMAELPEVVAIGECGYDFHWKTTSKEEQTKNFIRQIEIAKKVKKPLIIHSRDALELTLETLKLTKANEVGGVMHSYSGSKEMANFFIELGFYIGIGGPVTFLNAKNPKLVVQHVPIEYLLSETDSPYLTPHPFRGTQNSPKYIPLIVEEMAKLRGITTQNMAHNIADNAKRLFKL